MIQALVSAVLKRIENKSTIAENQIKVEIIDMKTAYEIALEKFGKGETIKLTDDQKKQIAEIEKVYKAKIAEKEVIVQSKIAKAMASGDFEQVQLLEKELAEERKRLNEEMEKEKEKVRQQKK